jgi:hypothetical protein
LQANASYTKHGDWFVYTCITISALLAVAALLGSRRNFGKLR